MIYLKQHELPQGCTCVLPDNSEAKFIKMDGMYAQWSVEGESKIKNYPLFIREGNKYKVVNHD